MAASLPFGNFMLSISDIILVLSWALEGNLREKFNLFAKNKTALILSSLLVLHIIGLLYTTDLDYGFEDVQRKLPLLLFPLMFSSSAPLSKKLFEKILSVFVLSVIVATLICFSVLLGYTHTRQIPQPQQCSIFISHIRFGLLISLSVFILGYFFVTQKQVAVKLISPLVIVWLISFMIMMESATGLICTVVVSVFLLMWAIIRTRKNIARVSLLALFLIAGGIATTVFYSVMKNLRQAPVIDQKQLLLVTKNGNPYVQDTLNKETENGNYVWLNVSETELAEGWKKRSTMDYTGKDLQGNDLKYTLIRFLTSKGSAKDAEGINALSEEEVKAVEKGIPNIDFVGVFNPTSRIQKIIWEVGIYLKGGNPSGHSVIQRFEFWKAAVGIIKENLWFGVGTGDIKNAFVLQYDKMNSPLTKEWRLRSHNQFLAIGTAFGIIGMGWFLITLFYPLIAERKFKDYFYLVFFIIAFLSFFTEDTIESQTGVTLFAFFNSFFLFLNKETGVKN